ncbi:MAG: methyltransferase domain-containing protein [Oscillospiraceae bacterium]|jgi:SAM-dependent methyltransferase|nr:methyltransferase domain-containing protein [Oscillospiraceae bacterium]
MSNHWSQYIQSAEELYRSRALRFHAGNRALWLRAIGAAEGMDVLEVGCGSGYFCHHFAEHLPGTRVTGLDADAGFIAYAKAKAAELALPCDFVQGDALATPFGENSFDLCFSHTVIEHLPTQPFLLEQKRVLRPGGRIAVLSVRTNASLPEHGMDGASPEELALWERLWRAGEGKLPLQVCAYPLEEREFPLALTAAGFRKVDVQFFCVSSYAPDSPQVPPAMALEQMEVERLGCVESVAKSTRLAPDALQPKERERLLTLLHARFDDRVEAWRRGEQRWDLTAKLMLAATGVK